MSVFDALDPERVPSAPDPNQPVGDPVTGPASVPATPEASVAPDPNQPASSAVPAPAVAQPEAPAAPTPAPPDAATSFGAFHSGQIVKTPLGFAVVVSTGAAPRATEAGMVDEPGYIIARLGDANETPHTAEELGLEAI